MSERASWLGPKPKPVIQIPSKDRCTVKVHPVFPLKDGTVTVYRCRRRAVVSTEDGQRFCLMHHPIKKAEIEAHRLNAAIDLCRAAGFRISAPLRGKL